MIYFNYLFTSELGVFSLLLNNKQTVNRIIKERLLINSQNLNFICEYSHLMFNDVWTKPVKKMNN